MKNPGLLADAKRFDALRKAGTGRREYTREEIELAGAWFEGEISTDAAAIGLGAHKSNLDRRAASALRQGLALEYVRFLWEPRKPEGGRA